MSLVWCCRKELQWSLLLAQMEHPSHFKVMSWDLLRPHYLANGSYWFFNLQRRWVTCFCRQDWQCSDILFSCLRSQVAAKLPGHCLAAPQLQAVRKALSSSPFFFPHSNFNASKELQSLYPGCLHFCAALTCKIFSEKDKWPFFLSIFTSWYLWAENQLKNCVTCCNNTDIGEN